MQIYHVDGDEGAALAQNLLEQRQEGLVVVRTTRLWVVCGQRGGQCEELRQKRGISLFHAHHLGGVIVVFPGDLSLLQISLENTGFARRALEAGCRLLQRRGLPARIDGNDLLLDFGGRRRKVASYAVARINGVVESVVHYSINVDVDMIRDLCDKPMIKVPGALSDYGITAEEVWEEVAASCV